jgi:peptide/nickel transport system permease protein
MRFKRLLGELWASTPGKIGLIFLGSLSLVSLYVVATFPPSFGTARWANPALWADNPKSAPPAWTNLLTSTRYPKHRVVELAEPSGRSSSGRITEQIYEAVVDYRADEPPSFLSFSLSDVSFQSRPPIIALSLLRPDAEEVTLHRLVISAPRRTEEAPYQRHDTEALRVVIGPDDRVIDALTEIFFDRYSVDFDRRALRSDVQAGLFSSPAGANELRILPGTYRVVLKVQASHPDDRIGEVRMVIGGSVFGAMGTDALGRDLAKGLLFGLPVALLIGIATSTVSTLLGMSLGMVSGYMGGRVDILIQRAADIVANVPVLPLLIFLVFIGGSQLWLILLVLVAFSWPGLTIMVRTMVLQLRSGQEVEAAQAMGASIPRVIFRHILPHVASYILAQLVFFAPSAILAEAGLSFLGLGDPTIPTWGQILEYGFRTGAVFLGYWWWVIPPGLLIVLTAVTFMFLALGLEPIVDPRLKGRRSWHF